MKRTNKILALLLAVLMVVSVLPISIAAEGEETAPVATDPGAISTAQEFVDKLNANPGGDYYLTADLDFKGMTFDNPYVVEQFYGTLDGNGRSIKNVTLSYNNLGTTYALVGLIGSLGAKGSAATTLSADETSGTIAITNLTIDGMKVTMTSTNGNGSDPKTATLSAGFLVGGNSAGSHSAPQNIKTPAISNVHVTNSIMTATVGGKFNDSMYQTNYSGASVALGGIVGVANTITIADCSTDANTSITATATSDMQGQYAVAGIIGGLIGPYSSNNATENRGRKNSTIDECVNNATLYIDHSAKDPTSDSGIGGMFGYGYHCINVTNCVNNGSISHKTSSGDVSTVNTTKMYVGAMFGRLINCNGNVNMAAILDCTSNWAPEGGDYLAIAGATSGDSRIVKCKLGTTEYNRENPVELTETKWAQWVAAGGEFTGAVCVITPEDGSKVFKPEGTLPVFNGIIYGNGCTLEGTFESSPINQVGNRSHTTIHNLNLNVTINATEDSKNIGGLVGIVDSRFYASLSHINANVKITVDASSCKVGGIVGYAKAAKINNCTVSGTITSNGASNNVAAFAGYIDNGGLAAASTNISSTTAMLNCVNNANIVLGAYAEVNNVGSFVGTTGGSWSVALANCTNNGNIALNSNENVAGGLIGLWNLGHVAVSGCADYGNLGTVYGGVGGDARRSIGIANFKNATFEMVDGASVRIDKVTGIRFAAKFNTALIDRLEAQYGADAVSYGIIIAPKAIVDAADGVFTTDALDALKAGNDAYANVTMYNDIVADKDAWFAGEEGQIAGSITGLEGLYAVNLVGRGYIKVVVDGEVVFEQYADYAGGDIANNTRSVARVATQALGDYAEGSDEYKTLSDILAAAKIN